MVSFSRRTLLYGVSPFILSWSASVGPLPLLCCVCLKGWSCKHAASFWRASLLMLSFVFIKRYTNSSLTSTLEHVLAWHKKKPEPCSVEN